LKEPIPLLPPDGHIHLWQVALADMALDDVPTMLTDGERKRADRFAFPHLTRRWLGGRLALRQVLGRYLQTHPRYIAFGSGVRGKPFVVEAGGAPSALEFNMSDAGDYVTIALATGQALGVDIEAVRAIEEADDIVERNFSALERESYRCLPQHRKQTAFFTAWTRKEAYTKAVGLGLYLPLDSFSVVLDPEQTPRLIEVDGSPDKAAAWTLRDIAAPPGHLGALVVKGKVAKIETRPWATTGAG
jgi:4'-phosphopantetheinyl transferase